MYVYQQTDLSLQKVRCCLDLGLWLTQKIWCAVWVTDQCHLVWIPGVRSSTYCLRVKLLGTQHFSYSPHKCTHIQNTGKQCFFYWKLYRKRGFALHTHKKLLSKSLWDLCAFQNPLFPTMLLRGSALASQG